MQTQFQYITDLAKQYHGYAENPDSLFEAINRLPQNVVQDIYTEYGDSESRFQPVNLLRAEVARELLNGNAITEAKVEEIKECIRTKDKTFFAQIWRETSEGCLVSIDAAGLTTGF